ncbi:MAG: hypothetical protein NW208_12860 [Bryobacter sp.]|nr:hypothetical protein [Bryobacter sp.]
MAFCSNCGADRGEAAYCPRCGAIGNPNSNPGANPGTYAGPSSAPPPSSAAPAGGITTNMAAALCYLLGLVTGIIFLALAPYNQDRNIRFHAWQSIILSVAWIGIWIVLTIVSTILNVFAVILIPVFLLLPLAGFILWLMLLWKAYNGQKFKLPIIGDFAEQQAGS